MKYFCKHILPILIISYKNHLEVVIKDKVSHSYQEFHEHCKGRQI